MVQGRRSRQRAPGPRRRCSMAPCSLLPAPCSMLHAPPWRLATGHGHDPAHRTPNIPPVPPSGDGLHCVEIQLLHCRASRRFGPPAAACWLAWLGGRGGEGGRARCWIGTGGVPRRWGAMGTELENVACGAVGRRSRRGRWALGSELPLGERDVDGIFGARRWTVHVPSSTPWQMDSRHWPPSAVGQWWAWRRVGTATPHRLKGVAPANRLTARHSPPARPPCPPSLSRAGLGPSDWPGGGGGRPSWGTGTPRRWPFCSCMSHRLSRHHHGWASRWFFFLFFFFPLFFLALTVLPPPPPTHTRHHHLVGAVHRRPPTRPRPGIYKGVFSLF